MVQRSEQILKSWKGAQGILKLPKTSRRVILSLMGAYSVFVLLFVFSGDPIKMTLALIGGGCFLTLTILMSNASSERLRHETQLRERQRTIELIRSILTEELEQTTDIITRNAIEKLIDGIDDIPDEKLTRFEPLNDVWKERVRGLEQSDVDQQEINKQLKTEIEKLTEDRRLDHEAYARVSRELHEERTLRKSLEKQLVEKEAKTEITDDNTNIIESYKQFEPKD